jgi:hypothetical protein
MITGSVVTAIVADNLWTIIVQLEHVMVLQEVHVKIVLVLTPALVVRVQAQLVQKYAVLPASLAMTAHRALRSVISPPENTVQGIVTAHVILTVYV